MEAELIGVVDAMKEALWLQKIRDDLGELKYPINIYCDNKFSRTMLLCVKVNLSVY